VPRRARLSVRAAPCGTAPSSRAGPATRLRGATEVAPLGGRGRQGRQSVHDRRPPLAARPGVRRVESNWRVRSRAFKGLVSGATDVAAPRRNRGRGRASADRFADEASRRPACKARPGPRHAARPEPRPNGRGPVRRPSREGPGLRRDRSRAARRDQRSRRRERGAREVRSPGAAEHAAGPFGGSGRWRDRSRRPRRATATRRGGAESSGGSGPQSTDRHYRQARSRGGGDRKGGNPKTPEGNTGPRVQEGGGAQTPAGTRGQEARQENEKGGPERADRTGRSGATAHRREGEAADGGRPRSLIRRGRVVPDAWPREGPIWASRLRSPFRVLAFWLRV